MSQSIARISTKATRACIPAVTTLLKLDSALARENPYADDARIRRKCVATIVNVLNKDFGRGKYTVSKRKARKAKVTR